MKILITIVVLIFITAILPTSCNKDASTCYAFGNSDTVKLISQQPIDIFTNCDKVKAVFVKKEDSRCPLDFFCLLPGTVKTEIAIDNNFNIKLTDWQAKDIIYKHRHFSFKLLNVLPYPKSNNTSPALNDTAIVVVTMK